VDSDGDRSESLRPQNTFNPILQRFYSNLQTRALDPHAALQEVSPLVTKYLEPDAALFENEETAAALTEFERQFETKVIPKKEMKAKKPKQWNEVSDELDLMMVDNADSSDRNKAEEHHDGAVDEDGDMGLDSLIQVNEVKNIGTRDPIGDFNKLLSQRSSADLFERLSASMWEVVRRLIDASYGDLEFKKAVQCISHLKRSCIVEEEPKQFNEELIRFKGKYVDKDKLWQLMVQSKVTLICKADFDDEDVCSWTIQDAEDFLAKNTEETVKSQQADDDSEDDDMDDLV